MTDRTSGRSAAACVQGMRRDGRTVPQLFLTARDTVGYRPEEAARPSPSGHVDEERGPA
ncbi:hypothetical protein ACGF12_34255 [Kitasatospora sp. NPDC048296]|uniref:hypothetical protein n=1 Tax=Kitasatospora sp. NPDC048296 TaxID=3364048 RepID=UPI0037228AF2